MVRRINFKAVKYLLLFLVVTTLIFWIIGCGDISMRGVVDDVTTEDPEWQFLQKISAPEGISNDLFGCSVSINGDYIIVGDQGYNSYEGRVYIYKRNGDDWDIDDTLTPTASGGGYGFSVDICGTQAVVGDYYDSVGGTNSGAIYIYEREAGTWNEKTKKSGPNNDDQLGYSVAVTTNIAIAGIPGYDTPYTEGGCVKVYVKNGGGSWIEDATIYATDGTTTGDRFGEGVEIYSNYIIAGAPYNGTSDTGKVYIYIYSGGSWIKQTLPEFTSLSTNNHFGQTVSIFGKYSLAGAPDGSAFTGSYTYSGSSWVKDNLIAPGEGCGSGVGVSAEYAIVGADEENSNQGTAFILEKQDSGWSPYQPLNASDGQAGDHFGCAVAVNGDYLVIGAKEHGLNDEGAVYIYRLKR